MTLDPTTITIPPDRQRQTVRDLDGLKQSIKSLGRLINPITLRRDGDQILLVAGGRRLQSYIELDMPLADTDYQFWENLTPTQAQIVELEENVKRLDLTWRETAQAYGKIHQLKQTENPSWTLQNTADLVNLSLRRVQFIMAVHKNIDLPAIKDAQNLEQAHGILQRIAERHTVSIVNELSTVAETAFTVKSNDPPVTVSANNSTPGTPDNNESIEKIVSMESTNDSPRGQDKSPSVQDPVICTDFLTWARDYVGPKFTFIHCDFPYGIEFENYGNGVASSGEGNFYHSSEGNYTELLDQFCASFPKFASYSCHVMFWFSMTFYETTKRKLESTGLWVHEHPLIWYKSDNSGIIPGGGTAQHLRRVYETAFLCSLGKRPVVKSIANCYAAPPQPNPIHPSHKSEPMLRHFFRGLIDSTTTMLDPTCGSGGALVAAEDCGAQSVLGLEFSPDYSKAALAHVLQARTLRQRTGG